MTPSFHPSKGVPPVVYYAPFIADLDDGSQILVQIFAESDPLNEEKTLIESVAIAFRDCVGDSWGVPIRTRRA